MKRNVVIVALFFGLFVMSVHATQRPLEIEAYKYHQKLMERQFGYLENSIRDARESYATISDGQPLAAVIHDGVSGCKSLGCGFPRSLEEWKDKESRLIEWNDHYPESPSAQIALARYYYELGWYHRGGGFSSSVSEDEKILYQQNVAVAKEKLEALPTATKEDPAWYTAMLAVGISQGWHRDIFNPIFEEATGKYPDYLPLYFRKGKYVNPWWHGSFDEFKDYVEETEMRADEPLSKHLYARLHWATGRRDAFESGLTDWERMRSSFEALVSAYPDLWNLNHFARYACLAGDAETLGRLLVEIGENRRLQAWFNDPGVYHACKLFAWEHNPALFSRTPTVNPTGISHSSSPVREERKPD